MVHQRYWDHGNGLELFFFCFFKHFFFTRSHWFSKEVRRETKNQQGSPLVLNALRLINTSDGYTGCTHAITWQWVWSLDAQSQASKLSERLQLDSDLDLKKALTMARNSEAVRAQQTTVRVSTTTPATSDLAALHKTAPWAKKHGQRQGIRKTGRTTTGLPQQAKTCSGVEGKLILALDVQLVMQYAHCARNVDISHLCASEGLMS